VKAEEEKKYLEREGRGHLNAEQEALSEREPTEKKLIA